MQQCLIASVLATPQIHFLQLFNTQIPHTRHFNWRTGPDMPFRMGEYIQAVFVEDMAYVGGGIAGQDPDCDCSVMGYNISSKTWTMLRKYRARNFAMTAINNQLVLVGGQEGHHRSKMLGAWKAHTEEWVYPYNEMPTARLRCSAVVHGKWLVVAGGRSESGGVLTCVEVMNTDTNQWYNGPSTPAGWVNMKATIIHDTCFFMGGFTGDRGAYIPPATSKVYSLSFHMHSSIHAEPSEEQVWKEIPGLQAVHSTPLTIGATLLALGGYRLSKAVTAIHLYRPDTEEWVRVGDLPTPRHSCACVMIAEREILAVIHRHGLY